MRHEIASGDDEYRLVQLEDNAGADEIAVTAADRGATVTDLFAYAL